MILKSWKRSWSDASSSSSGENPGHAVRSLTIKISSLQSALKYWHVVCWIIFSMDQMSASSSESKDDNLLSLFFNPMSCSFPTSSIYTQPYPLYCESAVQDPSIKQILCKNKACVFCVWCDCCAHRWALNLHQTKHYIHFGHATCTYLYMIH